MSNKTVFALLAVFSMLAVSLVPIGNVNAEVSESSNNVTFHLNYGIKEEGILRVTDSRNRNHTPADMETPTAIGSDGKTYNVNSIGDFAFRGDIMIVSAVIQGSVKLIGQ